MPLSRRSLLPALLGALAARPRLLRAADTVSAASRYSRLPPPDRESTNTTVVVGESRLELSIEGRPFELSTDALTAWLRQSAGIVAKYYGEFPIPEASVNLRGARGNKVMTGQANPTTNGAVVNVLVGLSATPQALARDWILIHELIHLAFPSVHRRHQWLTEGLATYVESIARAQAGALTADQVWLGFLDGMPKGLPRAGDKGLDYTPTWGRTYWGGALFCLLADVRIREQTNGEKSLQDGLRAICQAGYHMMEIAEVGDVLGIADDATGVPVLTGQYAEMRATPLPTEIDSLWQQLGVAQREGRIEYDNAAHLADIRRALTLPHSSTTS
ncbi:MAG: hypothetical protein JSV45_10050 [Chromatiales bacterium]|nr:MAG: hypothetical protein JSV45_10050 [Chromatiales bacterium]